MKINIWENLLRRSIENHISTYRHNKREDELLTKKISFYQRQLHFIDQTIHMNEYRFEQHARDDLGLVISYKRKPLEPSKNHQFYYPTTNKNWTIKEYSVKPSENVLQHKNLYEYAFERRSRQYSEELKQKIRLQKLRKEHFMNKTQSLIRDDDQKTNDWSSSEYAQLKLPYIHPSKSKHLRKVHFPIEFEDEL
jgi:hypothetical protein